MGATAEQLGVMKLSDALRKAQSLGMDLVEVAPTANPPVCKIVDFGKFRYDIAKQEKEKKSSGTKLKEIKFRVNIDDHDYMTKIRHGEAFLDKGNKVRVQLQFRGREMAHQEIGMQLMYKVRDDLNTMAQVEMEPKAAGPEHHHDALAFARSAAQTEFLGRGGGRGGGSRETPLRTSREQMLSRLAGATPQLRSAERANDFIHARDADRAAVRFINADHARRRAAPRLSRPETAPAGSR